MEGAAIDTGLMTKDMEMISIQSSDLLYHILHAEEGGGGGEERERGEEGERMRSEDRMRGRRWREVRNKGGGRRRREEEIGRAHV